MKIGIKVFKEDYKTLERLHILSALIEPIIPETEEEKRRYGQAQIRRNIRLKS